jgi:hypothetical protein
MWDDGYCASSAREYAGDRDDVSFPPNYPGVRFTRFEVWAL